MCANIRLSPMGKFKVNIWKIFENSPFKTLLFLSDTIHIISILHKGNNTRMCNYSKNEWYD